MGQLGVPAAVTAGRGRAPDCRTEVQRARSLRPASAIVLRGSAQCALSLGGSGRCWRSDTRMPHGLGEACARAGMGLLPLAGRVARALTLTNRRARRLVYCADVHITSAQGRTVLLLKGSFPNHQSHHPPQGSRLDYSVRAFPAHVFSFFLDLVLHDSEKHHVFLLHRQSWAVPRGPLWLS